MAKYIKLPDNSLFPVAEGEDYSAAMRAAYSKYPDAFGDAPAAPTQDTTGFKAAAAAGFERLKGEGALTAGKLGLMDTAAAEQYQKEREAAAAKRFTPTQDDFSQSPLLKLRELAGGSLPYMLAPAAVGAATLAAPVTGAAAMALGAGAAGLTSAAQFTGTNLSRQMETGKSLEETSLGKAVGAAVPQALLDTAAMALMPGVGKLFGSIGTKLTVEEAKAIASQTLGRTVADYAAKTGTAMGREGVTEATQQVLERLQAGLALDDPQARKEYIDSFVGGAVLGGVAAPVGRAFERAGARSVVEQDKADTAMKVAAETEAAKNTPEALRELDAQYRAATQQKTALDAQIEATKPKKGSTPEERAAHQQLKEERTKLIDTLRPVSQEYNKRKEAIGALDDTRQAELEAQTAAQPTAAAPVPTEEPKRDVQKLMLEQDTLRKQLGELEAQLGKAAPEQFDTLNAQRQDLQRRVEARATLIEEAGGSPLAQVEFEQATAAKMQGIDSRIDKLTGVYTSALEGKDYDVAAKAKDELLALRQERNTFTDKTAQQMKALQEKQTGLDQRGQTRDLGLDTPEQPVQEGVKYTAPVADTALAPAPIKSSQIADLQTTQQGVDTAQQELDAAVKGKTATPEALYPLLDKLNQAQNAASRAGEDVGRPALKPTVLDIFSPSNLFNTAYANGDTNLINALARQTKRSTLKTTLDTNATEREKLTRLLDTRLDLGGDEKATESGEPLRSIKRERADLFSTQYEPKQQAFFKNGTYPDKEMQDLYDKGGPAAVEYENVMRTVEGLSKQVTTKQGNAKASLYEQLVDLAAQHAELTAQMTSGVATPTKGEKVAGLQAKLGKGEAPATRPMDAAEKYQLQRRIAALENKYKLTEGKVAPVRDQIIKAYDSLYKTTPLEKASTVTARKEVEAKQAAKAPKAVTRAAKTVARIEGGDVRKEAETSQKMRSLARDLGEAEAEYQQFAEGMTKRYAALKQKYGTNDSAVTAFQQDMTKQLTDKAESIGKKTPEYKATLKEQIAYFQEVLPTAGKQTAATKRSPQVTRKQNAAPGRFVTSSAESRKQSEAEGLREKRRMFRDFQSAIDDENNATAYRLRESDQSTTVDTEQAQKVIDGLKLPDNVKFVYAPTTGKIPVRLLNMMAAEGVDPTEGMVQGAVFSDGTVLVVGDQHANVTDLEQTIAHELIGHYGIDTVIGMDKLKAYAAKTDVIALAEEVGGKKLVNEVLQTVRSNAALGRSEEIQKLQALREIIAHTEEARVTEAFRAKAGRWMKELVGMVRAGLRAMGLQNAGALSTSDVFYMLKQSRKAFDSKQIGAYRSIEGQIAFRQKREANPYTTIGKENGIVDKVLGNVLGLAGRVQFVDQYAAVEALTKKGLSAGVISDLEATNMAYLLRFGQQRSAFAGQFLTNGPVKAEITKKAGGTETLYRSTQGVSMMDVAKKVNESGMGNATEQEAAFTLYLAGQRADQVGWNKLNVEKPDVAKAEYQDVLQRLAADPKAAAAFKEAAALYQKYNAGLLDFLVQTGALPAKKAAELKAITYVPFYRVNGAGEVQLMIDRETPVRIANIKDEPQLQELIGGNKAIMPVFSGAVQNTFMITGMGMRNQAVKETSFMLQKLGVVSAMGPGKGPANDSVVRFKKNGEDYYAVIDKEAYGIPAELVVRGMEGIKTTLPAVIRMLGVPADLLRSFVTRNPAYAVRQVIRDPLNAWMTTGTDATPVLSSMKELGKMIAGRSDVERTLMETGAISSNVYSGDINDTSKFLKDISAGKSGWTKGMAKLDTIALQSDAATRAVIYKDSLAKGMTEQQALLRTLESMNFSRRGVSPSMQALSVMIPFFNAQIQGLDVIYRAIKGDMPYSKQLEIRAKMVKRGLLMAGSTMAYAALMGDDEAYKRAKPEERLSSWFVYVPGFNEPVRVPIPFEMGFLFKALPEAIFNVAMQDDKSSKAIDGLMKLAAQTVPLSLPQAVKPLTEAVLGKSFYSGDIESKREKDQLATMRYRDSTTELAKLIGSVTGKADVSPIMIDYLIRGYTGGLGIALIQLANPLLASDTKAALAEPTTKASKLPFIGNLFQPVEGRGTLDEAYARMLEIQQTKGSYKELVASGKQAEAKEFAQEYSTKLASMSVSGSVQKQLGELANRERAVRADPRMTTEQKDAQLARLDKVKVALAKQFLALTDK